MPFSDQIEQLEERIGNRVGRAVREFRDEIRRRIDDGQREILQHLEEATTALPESFLSPDELEPLAERARADGREGGFADLAASFAALDRGRTQVELLNALLAEGARYATRTALFLTRASGVEAWGAHGWGESERTLPGVTFGYDDDAWRRLAAGTGVVALRSGDCAVLCSRIESPVPYDGVLVPLVLRDRVAAALYADRMEAGQPLAVEALQLLTHAAALNIETLPFRDRAGTPTLVGAAAADSADATGLPLWDAPPTTAEPQAEPAADAGAPAAAEPEPPAVDLFPSPPVVAEPEPEVVAGDLGAVAEPEAVAVEPSPWELEEAPPAAPVAAEPVEEIAAAEPESAIELVEPPAPPPVAAPEPPVGEPPAAVPPTAAVELPEDAVTGAYSLADVPEPPRDTVLLDRSSFGAEPAAEPAPPAEPVEEETQAGGPRPREKGAAGVDRTTLVPPPSDFQGPGWAFSTTKVPVEADDTARHEEAHRLARLLVSEIRLYNEDLVEEGRRNRDIYDRLRDDIERSRQMYEERIDDRVRESTDYFQLELVRILAGGDAGALGR